MTSEPPVLFHFRVSHYNEKVRWALDHKGWPHVRRALVPGFHVPRVRWLTGQNQVPVLVLDGKALRGSAHILAEIERARPDPPLFPEDPAERERARALEAYFDEEVAPALRRLFWATYLDHPAECTRMATDGASAATRVLWRACFPVLAPLFRSNMGVTPALLARARESLGGYLDRIETELRPSGYLVGDRFGVADLAVASVMTAILRPPEFPYPLPEPWPAALVELRDGLSGREGFAWVLDIYRRHRGPSVELGSGRGA